MNNLEASQEFAKAANRLARVSNTHVLLPETDDVMFKIEEWEWYDELLRPDNVVITMRLRMHRFPGRVPMDYDFESTAEDIPEDRELPSPAKQLTEGNDGR